MVSLTGLEPACLRHNDLNVACLPISPQGHILGISKKSKSIRSTDQATTTMSQFLLIAVPKDDALMWYGGWDSNPH